MLFNKTIQYTNLTSCGALVRILFMVTWHQSYSKFITGYATREMFYLMTHSTHFIYGYMVSDIW